MAGASTRPSRGIGARRQRVSRLGLLPDRREDEPGWGLVEAPRRMIAEGVRSGHGWLTRARSLSGERSAGVWTREGGFLVGGAVSRVWVGVRAAWVSRDVNSSPRCFSPAVLVGGRSALELWRPFSERQSRPLCASHGEVLERCTLQAAWRVTMCPCSLAVSLVCRLSVRDGTSPAASPRSEAAMGNDCLVG